MTHEGDSLMKVVYISNIVIEMKGHRLGFGDPLEVNDDEYKVLMEDKYFMDYDAFQEWKKILDKPKPEPEPKPKRKVKK